MRTTQPDGGKAGVQDRCNPATERLPASDQFMVYEPPRSTMYGSLQLGSVWQQALAMEIDHSYHHMLLPSRNRPDVIVAAVLSLSKALGFKGIHRRNLHALRCTNATLGVKKDLEFCQLHVSS